MDLDDLERGRARLDVDYKGQPLVVEYYPERVGMRTQRAIVAVANPPYDTGLLIDELCSLLASWSLTRGGALVPIDAAGVGSLPMALSMDIAKAIMDDFRDPKSPILTATPSPSPTPSPAISEPAERWATAPTSLSPSSTLDGLGSLPGSTSGSPVRPGA